MIKFPIPIADIFMSSKKQTGGQRAGPGPARLGVEFHARVASLEERLDRVMAEVESLADRMGAVQAKMERLRMALTSASEPPEE